MNLPKPEPLERPWQVRILWHPLGFVTLRPITHTHPSVAFSNEAVENCGGAAEVDEDGYTVRCHEEPSMAETAREIARMSSLPDVPSAASVSRVKTSGPEALLESHILELAGNPDPMEVYKSLLQLRRHPGFPVWVSPCPFHDDQGEHLLVGEVNGLFGCRECRWRGNVVTFVALFEKITPAEAAAVIRERFGQKPHGE
jgi:hypothetical protein